MNTQPKDTNSNFDDELHRLLNFPRPKKDGADTENALKSLLDTIIESCSEDIRWKRFLLSLVHKRYHLLSPEAKALVTSQNEKNLSAGDGERCLFYLSIQQILLRHILMTTTTSSSSVPPPDMMKNERVLDSLDKAYAVLLQIAPLAGGSRDVSAILTDSLETIRTVQVTRQEAEKKQTAHRILGTEEPLSLAIGECLVFCLNCFCEGGVYSHLEALFQLAADTLDQDLRIIEQHGGTSRGTTTTMNTTTSTEETKTEFPSTLHIFIPHHGRGRPNNNKKTRRTNTGSGKASRTYSERQLVNSVAEILIWSRTCAAMSKNQAFSQAYETFLQEVGKSNKEGAKASLHTMQTIIRRLRKTLNSYAREQGFMLTDQFHLDTNRLNIGMVNKGKAGDISTLTTQAKKKENERVLKMINLRFAANPSKITRFGSVDELCRVWEPEFRLDDELQVLERGISVARLRASVAYLRKLFHGSSKQQAVVVHSMESTQADAITAVLVSAAMASWSVEGLSDMNATDKARRPCSLKLFIAGDERNLESFDDCVALVDQVMRGLEKNNLDVPSFMESGVATTKAVMNFLERNVGDGETMILITSADIMLPTDFMKSLVNRGCHLHCHDSDGIGGRLARENAGTGDITISLAWDTIDDLDLHVFLPSGEELYFSNKESRDSKCRLDVDMNAGSPFSTEPVENVFLGRLEQSEEAPQGLYKVVVQNYAYHSKERNASVAFRVVIDKNGKKERFTGECIGEGGASDVIVCEFDYGGRTIPFPVDEARKRAFGAADMVSITASTGQTLEALANLVQVAEQLEHLDEARQIANDDESVGETSRPVVAEGGVLEVTNRDRHDILLAKLPKRFHLMIGEVFGGPTLAEECAREVARRIMANNIPLSELKRAGYPSDIVDAVKDQLAATGVGII